MKLDRIMAAMLSMAAVCTAAAVTACAEDAAGSVVFYAEKSVLGQGLVVEPVNVPFYEGETGIDIVKRAAEVLITESEYGNYIEAFADTDNGAELPAEIAAAVPEMWGRNNEGYLSSYDYTAESGWNFFVNDESSMVGISAYEPVAGDVVCFRFSIYGYGSDLGIDNSSWGGSAALIEATDETDLATLIASSSDLEGTDAYTAALEALGAYNTSQDEIDAACAALDPALDGEETSDSENIAPDKTSPDTGIESVAVIAGAALASAATLLVTRKRR